MEAGAPVLLHFLFMYFLQKFKDISKHYRIDLHLHLTICIPYTQWSLWHVCYVSIRWLTIHAESYTCTGEPVSPSVDAWVPPQAGAETKKIEPQSQNGVLTNHARETKKSTHQDIHPGFTLPGKPTLFYTTALLNARFLILTAVHVWWLDWWRFHIYSKKNK